MSIRHTLTATNKNQTTLSSVRNCAVVFYLDDCSLILARRVAWFGRVLVEELSAPLSIVPQQFAVHLQYVTMDKTLVLPRRYASFTE